jgi:UDP-GlcNAc:undecaprenyl-phosphate GlcNAc-1-phosphate transferase
VQWTAENLLWAPALAFALAAVLIAAALPLSRRLGLFDSPGGRKQHEEPTSYLGGIGILVAVGLSFLVFDHELNTLMKVFLGCTAVLAAVGFLDDRVGVNWRWRIAVQAGAAVAMILAGVSVYDLGDVIGVSELRLGILTVPVTIFIVVGVINALNMIDGSDGLAGGQALVSLVLFAAFALYAGNSDMLFRLLTVAAAVAGFLVWNLRFPWQPRARVFLGNAGSMVLGFVIAWAAVRLTQDDAHPVSAVLAPWTIAIPLIDCVTLMFRRIQQGHSPFAADRNHLHHLLLDAGFTPRSIAWGLMVVSLALGMTAGVVVKEGVFRPVLVIAFLLLLWGYYRLTADRERAVRAFRRLHGRPAVVEAPATSADSPATSDLPQ